MLYVRIVLVKTMLINVGIGSAILMPQCAPPSVTAGEMMSQAGPFLDQQMHPTVIIQAFRQALEDLIQILKDVR